MSQSAYARAGVDIEAGDRAVELMKQHVALATRPEVLGGLGGFAGLFDASAFKNYRRPVLATSTDGVGTKVAIAQAMGVYHTVGWDLVGMLVDDLGGLRCRAALPDRLHRPGRRPGAGSPTSCAGSPRPVQPPTLR